MSYHCEPGSPSCLWCTLCAATLLRLPCPAADDLRHTGMRTTAELTAETMAAYAAAHADDAEMVPAAAGGAGVSSDAAAAVASAAEDAAMGDHK